MEYMQHKADHERVIDLTGHTHFCDAFVEKCLFTDQKITECDEYQLVGFFTGTTINHAQPPFAVSGEEVEAMSEILSEKTKDEFDDFIGRHFSGPPELAELWDKPQVVLV